MRTYPVTTAVPVVIGCSHWSNQQPLTLAAVPGDGGTLKIETQTAPGGAWFVWPEGVAGVVSDATQAVLEAKVHAMRFTAATADGVVEIAY
jgi:hypothetical protein